MIINMIRKEIFTFLCLMAMVLLISFVIYRLIRRGIEKRQNMAEERIKAMSQSEEGRKQLELESEKRDKQMKRFLRIAMPLYLLVYALILVSGLAGLYFIVKDFIEGNLFEENTLKVLLNFVKSVLFIILAIMMFIKTFKEIRKKDCIETENE